MIRRALPPIALAAALLAAAPALADTTIDKTIQIQGSSGFRALGQGKGESYILRQGALGKAKSSRTKKRRSLIFFGQVTDPQTADVQSPARVEFADPADGGISAAWRPQEALGTHAFDEIVQALNANRKSEVKQGSGSKAKLGFVLTTGDLPDNMQFDESQWFISILNGGQVDPYSGKPVSASNPCPGATGEEVAKMNADVAAREYTGVQDYNDYPGVPPDRYSGFWDPDAAAPQAGGVYAAFPRYPGLLNRALKPFKAVGLDVPWFTSRGNHDGLVQGNVPASNPLFRGIVTGCLKVLPGAAFDPLTLKGKSDSELFKMLGTPSFISQLLAGGVKAPPDPDRHFVSKLEYKKLHGGGVAHGFGYVDKKQLGASKNTASYYTFTKGKFRFVSLDTVAEGGGANGNLDNPQYKWARSVLDKEKKRYVIVYAHHTIGTLDNPAPDEDAGCTDPNQPGCDGDPRSSKPIHLGQTGKQSVKDLLLAHPNVIAFVNGHTHHNAIDSFRKGRTGFWQLNTAAHIDFPQQSRELEIMDNRDGTLSIFGTILDQGSPVAAPPPGAAGSLTDTQLGSLARALAANDPQTRETTGGGGSGKATDRNVELILRDPLAD